MDNENTVLCSNCNKQKDITVSFGIFNYCEQCATDLVGNETIAVTEIEGAWGFVSDMIDTERYGRMFISTYESNYFICEGCEEIFQNDLYCHDSFCEMCCTCNGEDSLEREETPTVRVAHRGFDRHETKYISKEKGDTIKSTRTFGVEIEMITKDNQHIADLQKNVHDSFGFEHDGSIDGEGGTGVEIVTPILGGIEGEKAIIDICDKINKSKHFTVNKTCGMHVHLGAKDFLDTIDFSWGEYRPDDKGQFKLDDKLQTKIHNGHAMFIVETELFDTLCYKFNVSGEKMSFMLREVRHTVGQNVSGELNGFPQRWEKALEGTNGIYITNYKVNILGKQKNVTFYYSPSKKAIKERKELVKKISEERDKKAQEGAEVEWYDFSKHQVAPQENKRKRYFVYHKHNNVNKLKTLLYFYTGFENIFLSMLPKSRRQGNKYCQKIANIIAPYDILGCQTQEDVETLWYKTSSISDKEQRKGGKYDSSRYYGINFHSLFSTNGTIEVRSHSATLDTMKILYWVALHQHIIDNVSNGKIRIEEVQHGADIFSLEEKTEYFFKLLKLDKSIENYVRIRINSLGKLDK